MNAHELYYLKKLSGGSGYRIFSDTISHTISADTIIPRENTVINVLELNDESVLGHKNGNVVYNFTGVTLLANIDILVAPMGKKWTKVGCASGSVGVFDD